MGLFFDLVTFLLHKFKLAIFGKFDLCSKQTWVHSGITQIPFKPIQGMGVIPIRGHSRNGNGVGIEWELYLCLILN